MESVPWMCSLIATILGLCEPFGKKMKTILILNFTGNLLVGTSYLMISGISGSAVCFTACLQVFVNYIFAAKCREIPKWVICVHAASFLAVNLITFAYWYDIIALGAAMLFVVSVAQTNTKHYRLLYISNSGLWILYDTLAKAYANLITHVVLFVAIGIAIYIRDKKVSELKG